MQLYASIRLVGQPFRQANPCFWAFTQPAGQCHNFLGKVVKTVSVRLRVFRSRYFFYVHIYFYVFTFKYGKIISLFLS